jgi:hypothetical protein
MYGKEPGVSKNKEFIQNSTLPKLSTIQAHIKDESNSSFASLHDSVSFPLYKTIPFVWIFEHDVIDDFETQKVSEVSLGPL